MKDVTPAEVRRTTWGRNLREQMRLHDHTVKSLQRALEGEGLEVTQQAIYAWCNGSTAPTVEKQVLVARVLRTPVSMLFPAVAA